MALSPYTPLSKLPNFDARTAPVVARDAHLPAVPVDQLQSDALMRRFANPPPWQPEILQERKYADLQPAHASVLMPIVMRPDAGGTERATLLLTERTTHLKNHSGQIAFPGGRVDETDSNAAHTALREAQEEIGLEAEFVKVIGNLPIYTTGSSFIVTPVVALVRPHFELRPNPYEVADVFEVPLQFLMDPANHLHHAYEWESDEGMVRREWLSIPWRDGTLDRFIWGATAGMLRNLYRFLSA